MPKIHDGEGEVIQDVRGRDHGLELDCSEQDRLSGDKNDVPEVRVAMAATDPTFQGARSQKPLAIPELLMAEPGQSLDSIARKLGLAQE